jgi:site-specific DNA-methyltransferase (adenine-specific)
MIKLLKGDCLELMKAIESGSVDSIITDPPYGTTACKWDSVIDFDLMWNQLNRIIKPNGAIVLFGSEPFSSALRMSNIKNYKYDWKWDKVKPSSFMNAKNAPMKKIEDVIIFSTGTIANGSKKLMPYNPQGLIYCGKERPPKNNSVPEFSTIGKRPSRAGGYIQEFTNYPNNLIIFSFENKPKHPTQKPIALMEYLIKTYTNENETVLDFTMGSGSTGVACVNTKRSFIGIEQDEKYFQIATDRINNVEKTLF